jgi:hypothetical protein
VRVRECERRYTISSKKNILKEGRYMDELFLLSKLIKERNKIEKQITSIIDRPGMLGHIGEFIASKIFNIELEESANAKGIDGCFNNNSLKLRTVNIKWYTKDQRMLDINPNRLPDYYLVLVGTEDRVLGTSKGKVAPWLINKVYLFYSKKLMETLKARGVKIGVATSITKDFWNEGEIYPMSKNKELILTDKERNLLKYFGEAEDIV